MKSEEIPDNIYQHPGIARRYHEKGGFAPERKWPALDVIKDIITAITPAGGDLLELGSGSGHLTQLLIEDQHFNMIHVTDSSEAMLDIAKETLATRHTRLIFSHLDFTTNWSSDYPAHSFDAVTSSLALHHSTDKTRLFKQVFHVLKPGGYFVFGDHMAGETQLGNYLIDRARALIRLKDVQDPSQQAINEQIEIGRLKQAREGDHCESVPAILEHLDKAGFKNCESPWQDFWLAVFIAQKPPKNSLI